MSSSYAGYTTRPSFRPGEPLGVHVATRGDARPCVVDVYRIVGSVDGRFEPSLELVSRSAELEPFVCDSHGRGRLGPGNADVDGCGWPLRQAFAEIPRDWQSGLYVAQFTDAPEPTLAMSAELGQDALFVVRPEREAERSPALVQLSVATWNAYHIWQNRNLYIGDVGDETGGEAPQLRAHRVSFHRPGIGLSSPSNIHVFPPKAYLYLLPFLQWVEEEGLVLDYCSGLDIGTGSVDLDAYRLVVTVGHDEYWTGAQRDRIEQFVGRGGNAAFFGGNLAYWQIRSVADDTAIECYKRGPEEFQGLGTRGEPLDPIYRDPAVYPDHDNSDVTVQFFSAPLERSTLSLMGVSMRNDGDLPGASADDPELIFCGAAWWWENFYGPPRPPVGFTVAAEHWAFDGAGLQVGDTFGAEQKVIGFECDGLDVVWEHGRPVPSGRESTPEGLQILAYADCSDWAETDYSVEPPASRPGCRLNKAALGGVVTMVHFTSESGGQTFTAPVTDWTHGLVATEDYTAYREQPRPVRPASKAVRAITANVLRELGGVERRSD